MSEIRAKDIVNYVVMPGIIPRCKALFTSGFGYIAFLMGQIYGMVRLLPAGHAYLNPANIGKFGIRHVIAEAANHLKINIRNFDQLLIFGALLAGVVLLFIQIIMIIFGAVLAPAMATSVFATASPNTDIAFMLLDQVFGIPGVYDSCIFSAPGCPRLDGTNAAVSTSPWPFHVALHELFRFYSTGLLLVGALIFLYFVVVVVLETATTGTPFGQRFQNIWVPIRLIMAIGLLIPINYGMNSGQYITLFAAKFGSGFATNAWLTYNETIKATGISDNPTGEKESLIGIPTPPDVSSIVQAVSLAHVCAMTYWMTDTTISESNPKAPSSTFYIQPYLVKNIVPGGVSTDASMAFTSGANYDIAINFFEKGDIIIRFGRYGGPDITGNLSIPNSGDHKGYVLPYCGDIRIKISDVRSFATGDPKIGAEAVQEYYFDLIKRLWYNDTSLTSFAQRYVALQINEDGDQVEPCDFPANGYAGIPDGDPECSSDPITGEWQKEIVDKYQADLNTNIEQIWRDYVTNTTELEITQEVLDRGWGGAGIWFNTISQLNGAFMDSVANVPTLIRYPLIMEETRELKQASDSNTAGLRQFEPTFTKQDSDNGLSAPRMASALSGAYVYWNDESLSDFKFDGNAIIMAINMIFGTEGLFQMTEANNHVHPLAQLAMLGKGLVEASIRNVATSTIVSTIGGLSRAIDNAPARLIEPISGFILSTAFVGLTAGLVLYYILPFLPFIYFFFAVSSWVKSIFEAMVGVPLWALAHLRLDGEGLPGNSASNGYFLIFEIFVRPILTVFALVAAIAIFTAQVRVLHFIWGLVTDNLAGYTGTPTFTLGAGSVGIELERGAIDAFFFTIVYAIVVYMMAIAAFKLINNIPDNILRWMGASVSSFSDMNSDPAEGLTRYAALSGVTAGREMASGIQGLGSGVGGAVGDAVRRTAGGP